jgi:RimJ/RimL family protein N-acetyltransferase
LSLLQPTLVGETVALRPIRPDDFDALYAVASDPELWAQHPARERWRREEFRSYFETWLLRGGGLAITERQTGRIIGASCYSTEGRPPGEIEIGWTFLARDHWGGATNAEVKRLMIDHAAASYETIVFRVAESNARSRRALEKIGGRLTDRAETIEVGGGKVTHVVYAIDTSSRSAGERE